MSKTDSLASARGRLAFYSRQDCGDPKKAGEARRDMRALQIEDAVREAVEAAPPLSDEQRQRISAILNGGSR